ncbi:hypothetical protein OIU84_024584 [Salix udensis]|uniref:Uncharacterized protein n=1 Tax=Salix udensis TaxID=889485 RepID=A0AAD6KHQ7_9ROSI|nr:hypothetical protein OIU84_024584 [Salix udensis]
MPGLYCLTRSSVLILQPRLHCGFHSSIVSAFFFCRSTSFFFFQFHSFKLIFLQLNLVFCSQY